MLPKARPLLKQLLFLQLAVFIVYVHASCANAEIGELTSWQINTTGAKGKSTNSTINALVSQITADVREVWATTSYVYVKSAGVPSYNVGPFNDGNPAYPSDRNW